jgi:hypothetical protein
MDLKLELAELQRELAQIDRLTVVRLIAELGLSGCLLLRLQNLKIKMYLETAHQTPHLHVDYGREHHAASYSIQTAQRLAGDLDRKYDRIVAEWITKKREQLLKAWAATQAGEDPRDIVAEISGRD